MTSAAPALRATLLFREPVAETTDSLAGMIEATFRRFSVPLKRRMLGIDDVAFGAGTVSVAVTRSSGPIDVATFGMVRRPARTSVPPREVAMRLNGHEGALSISVNGASREDALSLCYLVAACLASEIGPDLVHWEPSGTLYTPEEMRATAGNPVAKWAALQLPAAGPRRAGRTVGAGRRAGSFAGRGAAPAAALALSSGGRRTDAAPGAPALTHGWSLTGIPTC